MSLTPLTNAKEIRAAYVTFARMLKRGGKQYLRTVGWPGGNTQEKVYWNDELGIWSFFTPLDNRYWCLFGTKDAAKENYLPIIAEVNPPLRGINRRCAGLFARDGKGKVFLAHSGKIGGGKEGIGKNTLENLYRGGNWQTISWPDGLDTEAIVIGRVDSKLLPSQVSQFVFEVERIKDIAVKGKKVALKPKTPTFTPEFTGKKTYRHLGKVESDCNHGKVVSRLAEELENHGIKIANDRPRDLMILQDKDDVRILFEVKTSLDPTSVYTGVGQLMLNAEMQKKKPKRVLVLPGEPKAATRDVLSRLGIAVLSYDWSRANPIFSRKKIKDIVR